MGRKFDVPVPGGVLRVCVSAVDEAWELWICDTTHRLALGRRIEIDDAVAAYREGRDPVAEAGRLLAEQIERGLYTQSTLGSAEKCPGH
jgi:hypothetical protein